MLWQKYMLKIFQPQHKCKMILMMVKSDNDAMIKKKKNVLYLLKKKLK